MLKIHSFLQKIKKPIIKILPSNIGKYKTQMAVIAYMMTTVLFILSPDYIYGASNNSVEVYAKTEIMQLAADEAEEETAYEAIIRINRNNMDSKFILYDLTTVGSPVGYREQANYSKVLNMNSNNSEDKTEEEDIKADSQQVGAVAKKKVDSSSTKKKKSKDTEEAVKGTADTEQKTEKLDAKNTEQKVIDLSSSDIEILQRIVEAEATGEDIKGKVLVANVILNRVKDENFPNTIKGVVFQKDGGTYQFSPIKDKRYWSVKITKDTITAVERVMQGKDYSQGALYFSARSKADRSSMKWFDNNLEFLFQYGGHEFFKD